MIRRFIFPLLLLAPGTAVAAENPASERACVEVMLCDDVKPEDAALFEKYFGRDMQPVEKGWDAETLTE